MLLASERSWFIRTVNGVISPSGCELDLLGVRLGVVGRRKAFAAEEKKSAVFGWFRSGVANFLGVWKDSGVSLLDGVGVVGRDVTPGTSSNRWSRESHSSGGGGRFSLSAWRSSSCKAESIAFWLTSSLSLLQFEPFPDNDFWSPGCSGDGEKALFGLVLA